jgi:hypothetical protein
MSSIFNSIVIVQEKKRGVKTMAYKFGRAYQGMKRNFKIALGSAKIKENFDFWSSESTVESLMKSRKEFCQLRFEMRKQRQVNRYNHSYNLYLHNCA